MRNVYYVKILEVNLTQHKTKLIECTQPNPSFTELSQLNPTRDATDQVDSTQPKLNKADSTNRDQAWTKTDVSQLKDCSVYLF